MAPVSTVDKESQALNINANATGLGIAGIGKSIDRFVSTALGKNEQSFYDYFYNSFLTTANSLPMNSLWLVFIDEIPPSIQDYISTTKLTEIDTGTVNVRSRSGLLRETGWTIGGSFTKSTVNTVNTSKGLIIATSVNVVGENISTERVGSGKNGFIKGLVGQGRDGYPLLNIKFVENNVSLVDYCLRPWTMAVGHKSLKNSELKTNITFFQLSKMGARANFANRKVIVYENCCPVSVDTQEYNYTGSDVFLKRSVDFAFERFHFEEASESLLKLIQPVSPNSWVRLFEDEQSLLKDTLSRTFGGNSITQVADNLLASAKSFAENLVTGTVNGLATNTAGSIGSAVDQTVQGLAGAVQKGANDVIGSVNDSVNSAINSITGSGNESLPVSIHNFASDSAQFAHQVSPTERLTSSGYVEKPNPKDDAIAVVPFTPTPPIVAPLPPVDTNKPINQNDYVTSTVGLEFQVENPNEDVITSLTPIPFKVVSTNQKDYIDGLRVTQDDKQVNKNDYITGTLSVPYKFVETKENDSISGTTPVPYTNIKIKENDFVTGTESLKVVQVPISENDAITSTTPVPFKQVVPTSNDDTPSSSIKYTVKTTKKNDDIVFNSSNQP